MGPNNNGRNGELGKLTFESGTPCVDGHVNVESGFELNTMPQIQSRGNCDDSKGLVSLRSGSSTVEKSVDLPKEDCNIVRSETETYVQAKEKVRATETRSKNTQGEGQTGRNSESSTVQPDKVILSNYTDTDLSMKQKEDPDIKFVYESMLKGCKRPDSSDTVTKSQAARHYWIIWDSLKMSNELLYKESLQKNGESKYFQLLVPRSLKKEVLEEVHNGVVCRHFGCRKTYEKVKIKYYWYEMKNDVNSWV